MGLISIGETINKGISILLSRILPVAAVRLIAVAVSMAVSYVGMKNFIGTLRDAAIQSGINPQDLPELIKSVPPEVLTSALMNPILWIAVVVNVLVFLWAQAGVYMALYPNPQSGVGQPRSMQSVLLGGIGLMLPLLIINIIFGLMVTVGILLLVIPGIYLAVRYGFAPLLTVVEEGGAIASLKRSSELVSGYWMPVFLRLAAVGIIAVIGNLVLGFIPVLGGIAASVIFPPFLNACQLAVLESLREVKGSGE